MSADTPRSDRRALGPLKGEWYVPPSEELQETLAPDPRVDVFETLSGDTTWRFVALNGRIVADSAETFRSRAAAERSVTDFVAAVSGAPVMVSGSETEAPAFVVYLSGSGGWHWSLKAANGQILAESAGAYASKDACVRAARRVGDLAAGIQS